VAAVTPDPSNSMLTAAGAHAGVVKGLPCLLGVSTGMALMMFVVPFGLASLRLGHRLALGILHWAGAAFLLWLSWKIATSSARIDSTPERNQVGYLGAAAFQWVNPKSWLVSASAAGTFLSAEAGSPLLQAASLAALFFLAALPSGLVWLTFGAAVQHVFHTHRRRRVFNVVMGALLALWIAFIVW
jgi:threonine/homoserine/homoserine lactone efflux protein